MDPQPAVEDPKDPYADLGEVLAEEVDGRQLYYNPKKGHYISMPRRADV